MKITKEIEEFINLTITEHMGKEYPHFPTHNVNWGYPTQERLKRLWL